MREKITIKLPFRRDGKDDYKNVEIDFISNGVTKQYREMSDIVSEVRLLSAEIQEHMVKIKLSDDNKKIAEMMAQMKASGKRIEEIGETDFFAKRFNLIKRILIDNKCLDDDLFNIEFWDECVDVTELVDFIHMALNKDYQNAKKKSP